MSKHVLLGSALALAAVIGIVMLRDPGSEVDARPVVRPERDGTGGSGTPVRPLRAADARFRDLGLARTDFGGPADGAGEPEEAAPADPLAGLGRQERKLAEHFRSGAGLRTGNFTVITEDGAAPVPGGAAAEEGR